MFVELVPLLVSAVVALVIPSLTELTTKAQAPTWLKSLVTAGLSALTGVLTTVAYDPNVPLAAYGVAVGTAWLVSMRAYFAGLDYPGKVAGPDKGLDVKRGE